MYNFISDDNNQISILETIDSIEIEDPITIIISDQEDNIGAIDINGISIIDLINIIR